MLHAARKKWKNSRGTTMLLALLYLLVGLSVGAVVLTAASSSTGRIQRQWQDQQDYLAVTAAMDLMEKEIRGMTFTGQYAYKKFPKNPSLDEYQDLGVSLRNSHLLEAGLFRPAYRYYFAKGENRPAPDSDVVTRPLTIETEGMPTVSGFVRLVQRENVENRDFLAIYVELGVERDGEKRHTATKKFSGYSQTEQEWPPERGGRRKGRWVKTTYTTTITWDEEPVVTKGALTWD